jgi:broad specificity phosphatase PhoE
MTTDIRHASHTGITRAEPPGQTRTAPPRNRRIPGGESLASVVRDLTAAIAAIVLRHPSQWPVLG